MSESLYENLCDIPTASTNDLTASPLGVIFALEYFLIWKLFAI